MGCCVSSSAVADPPKGKKNKKEEGFHEKYLIGKRLGKGSFGQVHAATRVVIGQVLDFDDDEIGALARAVKIIDLRLAGPKLHKLVKNEVSHWKAVSSCQQIVKLDEVFYGNGLCYMVMERCYGSLLQYLEEAFDYDERFLGGVFRQMLLGIKALHELDIVHRDIKPGNFMVASLEGGVKIGDFGLSVRLPSSGKLQGECGTAPFMSPEMFCGLGYDCKTDVWSFGVVVYALLFGRYPYPPEKGKSHHNSFKQACELAEGPPSFKTSLELSCNVIAFVMSLLKRDTEVRTTAANALNSSYMVASRDRNHAEGEDLAGLEAALDHAKKLKCFEQSDVDGATNIDDYLNKLQIDKFNVPIHSNSQDFNVKATRISMKSVKTLTTTKSLKSTKSTNTTRTQPKSPSRDFAKSHGQKSHSQKDKGAKRRASTCAALAEPDDDGTSTTDGDDFIEDAESTCDV